LKIACELGVLPEQFWDMIPREFGIYVEGRIKFISEEETRHQRRTGLISAMIANFSGRTKKSYKIDDFMPKKLSRGKDMLEEVKKLNAMFGGEIRRK
jgi:hypothetical protein